MPVNQSGRAGHTNAFDNGPDLAGVIDEAFLNSPLSRQRSKLQAATGDKRFRTMPEHEVHRYIENAIGEISRSHAARLPAARSGSQKSAMQEPRGEGDVINEAFLSLPSPQQRARLQAATGDQRFLYLTEEELLKYIENQINQLARQEHGRPMAQSRGADSMASRSAGYDPRSNIGVPSTVSTLDNKGMLHQVQHDQLPDALRAGHTVVLPMTDPDGGHGYVPLGEVHAAHRQGYALGHQSAGDGDSDGWFSRALNSTAQAWQGGKDQVNRWKTVPAPPVNPVRPPVPPPRRYAAVNPIWPMVPANSLWHPVSPSVPAWKVEASYDNTINTDAMKGSEYGGFSAGPLGVLGHGRPGEGGKDFFKSARGTKANPRLHQGEDISAPIGTPIHAAQDGVVERSGWENANDHNAGYGQRIRITGTDGTTTIYGHNSQNLVKQGDKVKQGDIIGYTGITGNAIHNPGRKEDHLHFQVEPKKVPVDPAEWLNRLEPPYDTEAHKGALQAEGLQSTKR